MGGVCRVLHTTYPHDGVLLCNVMQGVDPCDCATEVCLTRVLVVFTDVYRGVTLCVKSATNHAHSTTIRAVYPWAPGWRDRGAIGPHGGTHRRTDGTHCCTDHGCPDPPR